MKDLIIGLIVGSLLTSMVFIYTGQIRRVERMESKMETIIGDVE